MILSRRSAREKVVFMAFPLLLSSLHQRRSPAFPDAQKRISRMLSKTWLNSLCCGHKGPRGEQHAGRDSVVLWHHTHFLCVAQVRLPCFNGHSSSSFAFTRSYSQRSRPLLGHYRLGRQDRSGMTTLGYLMTAFLLSGAFIEFMAGNYLNAIGLQYSH